MARTVKPCIGYFSHDVDMMQDKKIKIIKAKHGLLGYAVYLRLLEEAYRSDGYFLKADEDFNILFPDENNLSIESYTEILGDCLSKGLFSEELYSQYSILTSERIQKNYCDAISRRTSITFIKEYLMVEPFELLKTSGSDGTLKIDVNILSLNVDNLELNVDGGTQIKEEYNKTDKIITNNNNDSDFIKSLTDLYPNNKGSGSLKKKSIDNLKKIGLEELKRAIGRYLKYVDDERSSGFDLKYKDFSTFCNSGHKDYLDGTYKESIQGRPVDKQNNKKDGFYESLVGIIKDEQGRNGEISVDYEMCLSEPDELPF